MLHLLPYALMAIGVLISSGWSHSEAADDPQQLKAACKKGSPRACEPLGGLYLLGKGVKQDDSQAAAFYRKACDSGSAAWLPQSRLDVCGGDRASQRPW